MAGEYVRWLARDVKPMEKKELTPQEKRRNWWDYHKWHVVIAIVCLILAADLVSDVVHNIRNKPDYTIAYVGYTELPDDLARAVETAIATKGEDLNGNGQVQVELVQYQLFDESADGDPTLWEQAYSASMLLTTNIETVESMIYLLEDPAIFNASYPILCHTDGALPGEGSDAPMYYLWKDCPVLAGLEMGIFEVPGIHGMLEGDCQEAMANIAVARRGLWDDASTEKNDGAVRLFAVLMEGAE
ncbi:MAG: hypothetical protein IJO05_00080 [Oscillospiraceae bacterium]|nr:hypothetical protein [Oscillospiraceae bacterium]